MPKIKRKLWVIVDENDEIINCTQLCIRCVCEDTDCGVEVPAVFDNKMNAEISKIVICLKEKNKGKKLEVKRLRNLSTY